MGAAGRWWRGTGWSLSSRGASSRSRRLRGCESERDRLACSSVAFWHIGDTAGVGGLLQRPRRSVDDGCDPRQLPAEGRRAPRFAIRDVVNPYIAISRDGRGFEVAARTALEGIVNRSQIAVTRDPGLRRSVIGGTPRRLPDPPHAAVPCRRDGAADRRVAVLSTAQCAPRWSKRVVLTMERLARLAHRGVSLARCRALRAGTSWSPSRAP